MLYLLILTDQELSDDNYSEDFYIGLFPTEKQAKEIAQFYLKKVKGFCEFPCTYRIVKKDIADNPNHIIPEFVWIVQGYNINENFDEIDIVESPCFLTKEHAEFELEMMQNTYRRTEWALDRSKIGELQWREGFVRM